MNENEEKDNLDNFFKEHFASLPKYEESENRDKVLLNILLARIEEQRKEMELQKQKRSFFDLLRSLVLNFNFIAPKFAIPLALLFVFAIAYFLFNNQQNTSSSKIAKNQEISNVDSAIVKNNAKVEENTNIMQENKKIELGELNYNFASRAISEGSINNDSLMTVVKDLISKYFAKNKIGFKKNANKFETIELIDNDKVYKLELFINKNKKEVQFSMIQLNQSNYNFKQINPNKIKDEIQDELIKNLMQIE